MNRLVFAVCLLPLLGCQTARHRGLAPLENEGEVYLYLEPFPRGAERIAFTVGGAAAVAADGGAVPLELRLAELSAAEVGRQRLLAWGRLSPGKYTGFELRVTRATLETDGERSDLLVSPEPLRIETGFAVSARRATVLRVSYSPSQSVRKGISFAPALSAVLAEPTFSDVIGYCSNTGNHNLTVFDKRSRRVVGVLPTGRAPMGVVLDPILRRAYVALSGEDVISIVDLQTSEELGRIPLIPGDGPQELGLTPDGRVLVVTNAASNTAAFVDPVASVELSRVQTGSAPESLLMDRSGQRAYVLNRRSASITVIDVPSRAVVATLATDAEPVRARLNRAGDRLYVACAGSSFLTVFSLPDMSVSKRVYVGLGSSALEVDSRTDLIYVGDRTGGPLRVFDPFALLPVSRVDVPGPATITTIDDVENVLFSVIPPERQVATTDLVSGRSVAAMDTGDEPYQVVVSGARR
jgi:YVTN family beta-propeller protein